MRQQRGFTLLEILVALVILGFVMAGVAQGVAFGMRVSDIQARQDAASGDIDTADRLIRRLIAGAEPGGSGPPNFAGGPGSLLLAAPLTQAGPVMDVALRTAGPRLVVTYRPHRHVVALGPPPAPSAEVLLDGVQALQIAYWDAKAGVWAGSWEQKDLPALVRIRIRLASGGTRWPDIIAATARLSAGN